MPINKKVKHDKNSITVNLQLNHVESNSFIQITKFKAAMSLVTTQMGDSRYYKQPKIREPD